ncbi:unnamed protein product [Prunus armeniaca]
MYKKQGRRNDSIYTSHNPMVETTAPPHGPLAVSTDPPPHGPMTKTSSLAHGPTVGSTHLPHAFAARTSILPHGLMNRTMEHPYGFIVGIGLQTQNEAITSRHGNPAMCHDSTEYVKRCDRCQCYKLVPSLSAEVYYPQNNS